MPLMQDSPVTDNGITYNVATHKVAGHNFQFSAARIDDLGATEYTLGVVVLDVSGSTTQFRPEMERALKSVVEACKRSPRADNMMLRVVKFDDDVEEIHGFKPLPGCALHDYDQCLSGGGTTALYDACYTSIQSACTYAEALYDHDFDVNAVVFVITDGCEYPRGNSVATRKMIKDALSASVESEQLESIVSVLIGVNAGERRLRKYLGEVKDECGFTQFVPLDGADAATLARLGDFISRSVSAQSTSLGSGAATQSLVF